MTLWISMLAVALFGAALAFIAVAAVRATAGESDGVSFSVTFDGDPPDTTPGRGRRPSGPLTKEEARNIVFSKTMFARVLDWLRRLAVPRWDRMDVAQDVMMSAHQSFHTYDPEKSRPERWLNSICVHKASHYRDRAFHWREVQTTSDELDVEQRGLSAEQQIEQEQDVSQLRELLQHVSEVGARAVLIQHDIHEIPMREIAEQVGIPLSTAYKMRARAKEALGDVILPGLKPNRRRW